MDGAYDDSDATFERAVGIEQANASDGPALADTLTLWAESLIDRGAFARADPLVQRVLKIREKTPGASSREYLLAEYLLGDLHRQDGNYRIAESMYRKVLATALSASVPVSKSDIAAIRNNLAVVLHYERRNEEARGLYEQALTQSEELFGPDDPRIVPSLEGLALIYSESGDFSRSVQMQKRALAIRQEKLSSDHPDTAISMNNLAYIYSLKGDNAEAESLFQRVIELGNRKLGASHPAVVSAVNNLAELLSQ